ncbi:unnamed protein product [Mycena citricolor]|uniref:PH domain-containing protein n=1 Tax=Mycena citricolor TaxID=2018698 RepID=A0AAD2Q0L8_9AGAR|nr:unnamed protein product [Mycena citricolor]
MVPAQIRQRGRACRTRKPAFGLFLPLCTLGPPSNASAQSKLHIEGAKDGSGTTKSGTMRRSLTITRLSGGDLAWGFRSRSREDMMEWWNDIRMLCARYLVSSKKMERSGPVAAAVRSTGHVREEEDSEEGSSIDEKEDDDKLEYVLSAERWVHQTIRTDDLRPDHSRNLSAVDGGANVSHRPSKRQQETALEGRPPHAAEEPSAELEPPVEDAAPAPPVESRLLKDL